MPQFISKMKFSELPSLDRQDIEDRWRDWKKYSELNNVDPVAAREKLREKTDILVGRKEDVEGLIERAEQAIFHGVDAKEHPLTSALLVEINAKVPQLRPIFAETPVLVLPVLDYEAFAHSLTSGRRYVAVSLMMLIYPVLVAELVARILDALLADRKDEASELINKLIVQCWHLNSEKNHELIGFVSIGATINEENMGRIMSISNSMLAFMSLHEFAHIYFDHRRTNDRDQIRAQEFQADEKAVEWWIELMSPRKHWDFPTIGLAALFLFFAVSDGVAGRESKMYPSWTERYEKVKEKMVASDVPITEAMAAVDGLFNFIYSKAMSSCLFSLDGKGSLKAYSNPAGMLRAVNAVAEGTGSLILLIIDLQKNIIEKKIDRSELDKFVEEQSAK